MFRKHKTAKRILSLFLPLCLLLSLAACGQSGGNNSGGGQGGGAQQLSGTVYVPEFIDLGSVGRISYIDGVCASGDSIYLLATLVTDDVETTDPDTGETITTNNAETVILRAGPDGTVERVEDYAPLSIPEGMEGYSDARSLMAGAEGTLWVGEYMNYYTYNLPEDFDEETDDKWNYMSESTTVESLRQIDAAGNEIQRIDTTELEEKLNPSEDGGDGDSAMAFSYSYNSNLVFDAAGNGYMVAGGKLWVLDGELNPLFSLDQEGGGYNDPVALGGGAVGLLSNYSDLATDTYGYQLQVVDVEKQSWGATYVLPANVYEAYPGGGDYLFYYMKGDTLYGCKAGEAPEGGGKIQAEGEELLNWLDADVNANNVQFFTFLSDGRVAVLTQDYSWGSGRDNFELAILTATDRSTLPEKTIITLGALSFGYSDRNKVVAFNRSSDQYRIEVTDYSQFNTEDDPSGGLSRLSTEIIAGKIPDILVTDGMPLDQLAAKGMLEDLWPWIDGDTELGGREALMEHVFDVASDSEGHLYQVFSSFTIDTVAGAPSVVGDRMSWTVADLEAALAAMPEGCTLFSTTDDAPSLLQRVLAQNMKDFVDWDTGKCSFDSDEFRAILQFCAELPATFDWENYQYDEGDDEPTRISEGRQMLLETEIYGYSELQMHKAMFGGSVSYVGYPMEDGSCGSSFAIGSGMAMSSACQNKEGAWSYMRQVLLPSLVVEYADTDQGDLTMGNISTSHFPVNKEDFDFMTKVCMTPRYQKDADGNLVLDENGQPIEYSNFGYGWGSLQVDIMSTTQEEYDQFMALYNAVDRIYGYDERIYDIISDTAAGYFAGDTPLDTAVNNIQSKAELYVNENR